MRKIYLLAIVLIFGVTTACGQSGEDVTFTHFKAPNRVEFDYTVLVPDSFDPGAEYPTIIAFPPGDMNREAVIWSVENIWGATEGREWLIVIPTIPKQSWHTHPSHHALEAFMDRIKDEYKVANNRFHLTGYGEGARAAITYANMSSKYFDSFTVAGPKPWNRWEERDLKRWPNQNAHIAIRILVGELDKEGMASAERVEKIFSEGGVTVSVKVIEGFGEDLDPLLGGGMLTEIAKNAKL